MKLSFVILFFHLSLLLKAQLCTFNDEFLILKESDYIELIGIDSNYKSKICRKNLIGNLNMMIGSLKGLSRLTPFEDTLKHFEYRNWFIKNESEYNPKKLSRFLKRQRFKLKVFHSIGKNKRNFLFLNLINYKSIIYQEKWYLHPEIHSYSDTQKILKLVSNPSISENRRMNDIFGYPKNAFNFIPVFGSPSKFVSSGVINKGSLDAYKHDKKYCEDAIYQFKSIFELIKDDENYVILFIDWTVT